MLTLRRIFDLLDLQWIPADVCYLSPPIPGQKCGIWRARRVFGLPTTRSDVSPSATLLVRLKLETPWPIYHYPTSGQAPLASLHAHRLLCSAMFVCHTHVRSSMLTLDLSNAVRFGPLQIRRAWHQRNFNAASKESFKIRFRGTCSCRALHVSRPHARRGVQHKALEVNSPDLGVFCCVVIAKCRVTTVTRSRSGGKSAKMS